MIKNKIFLVNVLSFVIGIILTVEWTHSETNAPESKTKTQVIQDITPSEAFVLVERNKDNPSLIILDVRTQGEFAGGHIENAINLDYLSETFRNDLARLDKNKKYLTHCRSGNRSGKAMEIMKELGFREVYNMTGGILEWEKQGLPTTK